MYICIDKHTYTHEYMNIFIHTHIYIYIYMHVYGWKHEELESQEPAELVPIDVPPSQGVGQARVSGICYA